MELWDENFEGLVIGHFKLSLKRSSLLTRTPRHKGITTKTTETLESHTWNRAWNIAHFHSCINSIQTKSSNANLYKTDSNIRVKISANNYLSSSESSGMYCRVLNWMYTDDVSEVRATRTSKTSVDIQLRKWQYIPEDSVLLTRRRENLKSHKIIYQTRKIWLYAIC
jgi:hypothetical protein